MRAEEGERQVEWRQLGRSRKEERRGVGGAERRGEEEVRRRSGEED